MRGQQSFQLADDERESFYFIAHLLDRVMLGHQNEEQFHDVERALEEGTLLELHLFNEAKTLFIRCDGKTAHRYEPLEHHELEDEWIQTRRYRLEKRHPHYRTLVVREYYDVDPQDHHAYIKQTMLFGLEA